MERITSRKNKMVAHLRSLGADRNYRRETGLFVCDGEKFLREAIAANAEIECIMWCESPPEWFRNSEIMQFTAPKELVEYASALQNTSGPVFSVKMKTAADMLSDINSAIVLESVQDPGNVGTVLRTALAMGIDTVLLMGACADVYNPKTVRSTMGAVFKQSFVEADFAELEQLLTTNDLPLFGAALSEAAQDIRSVNTQRIAVAIGSEGAGLSEALLARCSERLIIPMSENCESLNAAVAASIVMWEIARRREI